MSGAGDLIQRKGCAACAVDLDRPGADAQIVGDEPVEHFALAQRQNLKATADLGGPCFALGILGAAREGRPDRADQDLVVERLLDEVDEGPAYRRLA